MAEIDQAAVTATTSATLLADGDGDRTNLTFTNTGSVTVYLGGSGVTTTAFVYPLAAGEWVQWTREANDVAPTCAWYGRTASSSANVAVGKIGN